MITDHCVDLIEIKKRKMASIFIDRIENQENHDKKVKLFVDHITYYDSVNANNLQIFLMELLNEKDKNDLIIKKIQELEDIKNREINLRD